MKTVIATTCFLFLSTSLVSAQSFPGQPIQRTAGAISQGLNQTVQTARGITRQGLGTVQNATRNIGSSLGVGQRANAQVYNGQSANNQFTTQGYTTPQVNGNQQYQNVDSSPAVYQGNSYSSYGQSQPVYQSQPVFFTEQSFQNSGIFTSDPSEPQFDSSMATTDQVHTLQYDGNGREYINVNGENIYFDGPSTSDQASSDEQSDRYQAGYGSYDQEEGQAASQTGNDDSDDSESTADDNDEENDSDMDEDGSNQSNEQLDDDMSEDDLSEDDQNESRNALNDEQSDDVDDLADEADAESEFDTDEDSAEADADQNL